MTKTKAPHTATCRRCRATLTSARSVARGYGDRCWTLKRREDAVQAAGFKPHQVASALELLEDGALIPLRPGTYIGVSTDGMDTYVCTAETCTCAAFEAGRRCYPRAAVLLAA